MRVKCIAKEHNAMSWASAHTPTAQARDEHTNHKATMPPSHAGFSAIFRNFFREISVPCHFPPVILELLVDKL